MLIATLIRFATDVDVSGLPQSPTDSGQIQNIIGIVFGIIGVLSVLMVTISGFRYITSNGDPQQISKAKNGIIYALVGVAVAILAEAIVAFVVNNA